MISQKKRDAATSSVVSLIFLFLSLISNLCAASYSGDLAKGGKKDSVVVVNQESAEVYISSGTMIFGKDLLQGAKIVNTPIHLVSKKVSQKVKSEKKKAVVYKPVSSSSLSSNLPRYNPDHSFENSYFVSAIAAVSMTQNQNPVKKYLHLTNSLIYSEAYNARHYQKVCTLFCHMKSIRAFKALFINKGPPLLS